jgi:hypothetical protein
MSVALVAGARNAANFVRASLRIDSPTSSGHYDIVATEYYDGRDYRTGLQFAFCTSLGGCRNIFLYKTDNALDYMVPGVEGAALVTVWESGSAVWTRGFRLTPNQVSLVLERGAHFPPELTADAILIDSGWVPIGGQCCTAAKTEIWTWAGSEYELAATVPFHQRYVALTKLDREANNK